MFMRRYSSKGLASSTTIFMPESSMALSSAGSRWGVCRPVSTNSPKALLATKTPENSWYPAATQAVSPPCMTLTLE